MCILIIEFYFFWNICVVIKVEFYRVEDCRNLMNFSEIYVIVFNVICWIKGFRFYDG